MPRPKKSASPFRYFNSSPEVIRLVVMMYVSFPLSLRNVEDQLAERGIDICHETVRHWWNRFGPLFAADVRRQRASRMRGFRQWKWHLDEVYGKINGEMHYLWRAVDQEGEVLESYVTKTRDKTAALRFMKKTLKRHGSPEAITADGLRSYSNVHLLPGTVLSFCQAMTPLFAGSTNRALLTSGTRFRKKKRCDPPCIWRQGMSPLRAHAIVNDFNLR